MATKDILQLKDEQVILTDTDDLVHVYRGNVVCDTDTRGFSTPKNKDPLELVLDSPNGFISLWHEGAVLRWRFQKRSISRFDDPDKIMRTVEKRLGEALMKWGDATPVTFKKASHNVDFEIVVEEKKKCSLRGCTLARAFFPDSGRHNLIIFPTLFQQSKAEQVETLIHELGHIFGLRHFFAQEKEKGRRSELYG